MNSYGRDFLPKPNPGVEQQFLFCDTRLLATCYLLNKIAIHFCKDIVILRGFLHGLWISLHMHQTNR